MLKMAIKKLPYSRAELFATGPQKTFTGVHLNEIAFPTGGIGTGSISLSGRGALVDWEIFNRPNLGYRPDFTFFSLWAEKEGEKPVFRVLEGRLFPPFQGEIEDGSLGFGPRQRHGSGLLRMESCSFTGSYPFGRVELRDKKVPLTVSIEGFNPFIPTNDRDSSIPVAIFNVTLENRTKNKVKAALALNMENRVGHPEVGKNQNQFISEQEFCGLLMTTKKYPKDSPRFGTMALVTPWKNGTYQTQWDRSTLFDDIQHFVDTFGANGRFDNDKTLPPTEEKKSDIGSIGLRVTLMPGEKVKMPVLITWHFPWYEKYWGEPSGRCCSEEDCPRPKWKNYYATVWKDAWDVARYTVNNLKRLERETRLYHDALFSSTLPTYVLDAISSQTCVIKTATCIRLTDGTLYGWEGTSAKGGCCEGTCTHVWNYAQAVPYLFPRLERSMREADYTYNLRKTDGHMQFRMELPLGSKADHSFHAASDGQLGGIMRVYREWLICGDDKWLKKIWPSVKKALEYAWVEWDADRDGLIEGIHHNTLDIELHGQETMSGSMYLGALRAGEIMARYLGEDDRAEEYRRLFESGSKKTDRELFNGGYYIQRIDNRLKPRYQFGLGCLCDQVIGQWYARMLRLGDLYRPENVKKAISSVFKYNFKSSFFEHQNPHRVYALNDEGGLLICTWPRGGRPAHPLTYSFECMIGFEYQVASHLIYEGFIEEGLSVVKAIRDRHDGFRRNPWNEFECGNHYARSMANWAVMLALSGFSYSAPEKRLGFAPRISRVDFRCFFSMDSGWGIYRQKIKPKHMGITVDILYGHLDISRLEVGGIKGKAEGLKVVARLGRQLRSVSVDVVSSTVRLTFKTPVRIKPDCSLKVRLRRR